MYIRMLCEFVNDHCWGLGTRDQDQGPNANLKPWTLDLDIGNYIGHPIWLAWSGSNTNTPVIQKMHIHAQSESERAASSPGIVPVGPCM